MLGLGMTAVFGFLTFRNFHSRKPFWGIVSSFGLLLGLASLWIDYDRATSPPTQVAQVEASQSPWAKGS